MTKRERERIVERALRSVSNHSDYYYCHIILHYASYHIIYTQDTKPSNTLYYTTPITPHTNISTTESTLHSPT